MSIDSQQISNLKGFFNGVLIKKPEKYVERRLVFKPKFFQKTTARLCGGDCLKETNCQSVESNR